MNTTTAQQDTTQVLSELLDALPQGADARSAVKAAVPRIRAQVAAELRAAAADLAPETQYREGLIDGLERGARIAEKN